MDIPVTVIDGVEYSLDTTLRVAYTVQGMNNHKPYSKVFEEIGDMTLEKQIEILFVAFKIANPEKAASFGQSQFFNYYLEHFKLKDVMDQLKAVVHGVLGDVDEDEVEEKVQGN